MQLEHRHLMSLLQYAQCQQWVEASAIDPYRALGPLIPASVFEQWWARLYTQVGDEDFGWRFGLFLQLEALGAVYPMSLASQSWTQMLYLWQQHAQASCPILALSGQQTTEGYRIFFQYHQSGPTSAAQQALVSAFLVLAYREMVLLWGAAAVVIEGPKQPQILAKYWKTIRFKTGPVPALYLAPHGPAKQQPQRQFPEQLATYLAQMTWLLPQMPAFAQRVRYMLLHLCDPTLPNLQQVAAQLYLTERSLQRRLQAESTSYRTILNAVKQDLYTHLDKVTGLSLKEKSYLLGYSSASALLHAKKKWTVGME